MLACCVFAGAGQIQWLSWESQGDAGDRDPTATVLWGWASYHHIMFCWYWLVASKMEGNSGKKSKILHSSTHPLGARLPQNSNGRT